jgi:hypothetical protein
MSGSLLAASQPGRLSSCSREQGGQSAFQMKHLITLPLRRSNVDALVKRVKAECQNSPGRLGGRVWAGLSEGVGAVDGTV